MTQGSRSTRAKRADVTKDLLHWTLPRLIGAGYGLFSQKAINSHWPQFIIIISVLKKYRGKNSLWFMIYHAMKGLRKHEIIAGEAKAILARLIGAKPRHLYQLSGIYRGMQNEHGAAVATAAMVEITRIINEKRSRKKSQSRRKKMPIKISARVKQMRLK